MWLLCLYAAMMAPPEGPQPVPLRDEYFEWVTDENGGLYLVRRCRSDSRN